jgi:hypothetical protein
VTEQEHLQSNLFTQMGVFLFKKLRVIILILCVLIPSIASARIQMVALPDEGVHQLTIYNSEDLTLVRNIRMLTFKKGNNRIEFSWNDTFIDPTSVTFSPLTHTAEIEIIDTKFPPGIANTLVWNVKSDFSGKVPVTISYFVSGIFWAADYNIVLNSTEDKASLQGFVEVLNRSGENYEKSQIRLVVGKINLTENIARKARIAAQNFTNNDKILRNEHD